MNKTHLTQVWQRLSVVCVLFLVTSIISIQGGSEFLGRLFGEKGGNVMDKPPVSVTDDKVAVAYFAAIISGGLLLLATSALALHAKRYGDRWHSRIPVVWLVGLETSAWAAKLVQVGILIIFVALPVVGMIWCIDKAESGDICEQDTNNFYKGSETTLLSPPVAKDEHNQMRLRRAGAGEEPCIAGIELFPRSWTPLLFYGLPITAGGMAAVAVILIFVPRSPPQSKHSGIGKKPSALIVRRY